VAKRKGKSRKRKQKSRHHRPKQVHTGSLYLEYSGKSHVRANKLESFRRHLDLELAVQRDRVIDFLYNTLSENCATFNFSEWVRVVSTQFSNDPLSTEGSLRSVGGRFNFGRIDDAQFTPFRCLYVASDRHVGLSEYLQRNPDETEEGITAAELNLLTQNPSFFGISGNLQHVLNITNGSSLTGFLNLIKGFKIPDFVNEMADKLDIERPKVITKLDELMSQLLDANFKYFANFLNVPSNSQWFGQICFTAGIEAIVYPSVRGKGDCLAIFPENFLSHESYVELIDAPPNVFNRRIEGPQLLTR